MASSDRLAEACPYRSALDLAQQLEQRWLRLWEDDDHYLCVAPPDTLTDQDRTWIKFFRAELLHLVTHGPLQRSPEPAFSLGLLCDCQKGPTGIKPGKPEAPIGTLGDRPSRAGRGSGSTTTISSAGGLVCLG